MNHYERAYLAGPPVSPVGKLATYCRSNKPARPNSPRAVRIWPPSARFGYWPARPLVRLYLVWLLLLSTSLFPLRRHCRYPAAGWLAGFCFCFCFCAKSPAFRRSFNLPPRLELDDAIKQANQLEGRPSKRANKRPIESQTHANIDAHNQADSSPSI